MCLYRYIPTLRHIRQIPQNRRIRRSGRTGACRTTRRTPTTWLLSGLQRTLRTPNVLRRNALRRRPHRRVGPIVGVMRVGSILTDHTREGYGTPFAALSSLLVGFRRVLPRQESRGALPRRTASRFAVGNTVAGLGRTWPDQARTTRRGSRGVPVRACRVPVTRQYPWPTR